MQLTRLVQRSGKAVWLLVLVPVLAVAASAVLLAGAAPTVRTLATVSVIAPEGSSTAANVTQAVDGFRSTITSDTVLSLASDDTGASLASGDVAAERIGTSNLVELRLDTAPGEDAQALMQSLISHADDALFASTITSAKARVDTAQQRYEDAIAERDAESARTGLLLPIEAYRAKAAEVTQLRVALATGTAIDRENVQTTLAQATKDLVRIGRSVNAFESLEDSVSRTRSELGTAKQEADSVTARRAAATDPESVTITGSTQQSTRTTLVRGAVTALVVGLALALGLVLLIGLLRHPDRRTRPDGDRAEPAGAERATVAGRAGLRDTRGDAVRPSARDEDRDEDREAALA